MKKLFWLLPILLLSINRTNAQTPSPTINGVPPPFIFNGTGVSQSGQTFTFSSSGGGDAITSPNSTLNVGGSAGATTLDLAGSAGKIMAGATPALTFTPILGIDGTSAGTLQTANGASAAHTIWGSAATTSNTILGFATVPTTGHVVTCTVSGTTCTLTDGGAPGTGTVTAIGVSTANGVSGTSSGGATPNLTITLGAITPSTVNGLTLLANATGFSVSGGTTSKTLSISNSLTLAGTDATTMTFPATSTTVAGLGIAETFSAVQTISAANGLVLSAMTGTTCLEQVSGVVTSTGSACGSGGGTPAYPLTITGGVSGGVVYGSSSTQLTVSPAGTANSLIKWGGAGVAPGTSLYTDNGTTGAYTGTGGVQAAQFVGTGTTPAAISLPAGTGSIPTLAANSAGFAAPTTGGTSYLFKLPATISGAGLIHAGATGTVDGVNESALTNSLIALADFSATGTPSSTTFLRGDNTWSTPSGGGTPCTTTGSSLQYDAAGSFGCISNFTSAGANITAGASGVLDLSAATGTAALKVPSNTTNTATAAATIDFDTTNKNYHGFVNGADSIFANFASAPTTNVIPKAVIATGNTLLANSSMTDNATNITTTDTGGFIAPVFVANGTTAGFFDLPQGTTSAAVAPCNTATSICFQAPTAVTSQLRTLAGTPATGFTLWTNVAGVMTETIAGTQGTITSGPGLFGTSAINTVIASTVAAYAGHFTNIQVVASLGGTCTTLPQFNVFDGTTNVGTAVVATSTTQTKGTGTSQAQTQTFAAGDIVGIYISTAGGSCTTDSFIVSAQYSEP